ncbi:MAG: fumarylacetoacetate hydrolase family protein [Pseudomonadota bacterium]
MSEPFVFSPPAPTSVPVLGGGLFPVRRVFCIGRNYADHVREMGGDPRSDPPVFFCKPADAVVPGGADAPYPPGTDSLHFEGELVIALQRGGTQLSSREEAGALIFGQGCGCDLTRRDLQDAAKSAGAPWDVAKGFDASAPVGMLAPLAEVSPNQLDDARLITLVNGEERQNEPLTSMIWTVPEIIIALSQLFQLQAGDLIFTGTPEGVGPLRRGDQVRVRIGPLPDLSFRVR